MDQNIIGIYGFLLYPYKIFIIFPHFTLYMVSNVFMYFGKMDTSQCSFYMIFKVRKPRQNTFYSCATSIAICILHCILNIGMQEFKNFTSLTELGLSDNDISTLPPELVSI